MDPEPAERLQKVRQQIIAAEKTAGREPGSTKLVAVSKTHSAERVRALVDEGQLVFGENRVQEAKEKISQLPNRLEWHLIGHLQSNKVRVALPLFSWIHSVNSLDLAADLDRIANELGLFPRVLLQVNVAGEASKFGFSPAKLCSELDRLFGFPRLQIQGLMSIPPLAADPENSRRYFVALRQLRDELAAKTGVSLDELSMGMSNDFTIAIEEGATMVRIGTALFGPRQ
jgi:pyridoxal phosphate enzyme (YggS family)